MMYFGGEYYGDIHIRYYGTGKVRELGQEGLTQSRELGRPRYKIFQSSRAKREFANSGEEEKKGGEGKERERRERVAKVYEYHTTP